MLSGGLVFTLSTGVVVDFLQKTLGASSHVRLPNNAKVDLAIAELFALRQPLFQTSKAAWQGYFS